MKLPVVHVWIYPLSESDAQTLQSTPSVIESLSNFWQAFPTYDVAFKLPAERAGGVDINGTSYWLLRSTKAVETVVSSCSFSTLLLFCDHLNTLNLPSVEFHFTIWLDLKQSLRLVFKMAARTTVLLTNLSNWSAKLAQAARDVWIQARLGYFTKLGTQTLWFLYNCHQMCSVNNWSWVCDIPVLCTGLMQKPGWTAHAWSPEMCSDLSKKYGSCWKFVDLWIHNLEV